MSILPAEAEAVLLALAPVFTEPTFRRFVILMAAALLTTGRRPVANLLRTVGALAGGHKTSYQRVLSGARRSGLRLACAFCRLLLRRWALSGPVTLVGDDTVESHPGRKVYGKARHRDPVRSSRSYTAWRYGHKWVVLAVLVRLPFARRPRALPVLAVLYRSGQDNRARRRPHRTPAQLMIRLLRLMLRWFPDRPFVFVGDAGYGTHKVARFAHRHRARLTLVSKLHPDANLFEPPPAPLAGEWPDIKPWLAASCWVRRTLAPRGRTPILPCWDRHDKISAISAITLTPRRHLPGLAFQLLPDKANFHGEKVVAFLRLLRRRLPCFTVVWDRNRIHSRSRAVRAYLDAHPEIVVEDFPGYAPELNPDELVWCWTKYGRLSNYAAPDLRELRERVEAELEDLRDHPYDLLDFIDHTGLSLAA